MRTRVPLDPAWLVNAGLLAVGLVLLPLVLGLAPVPAPVVLPWWLLAVLFALAERFVVHVPFRRQTFTATLGELPLVLGLALAHPLGLFVARLLGGGLVLLTEARRSWMKFAFNLGHFVLETTLAVLIYRALLGGAAPEEPRGWAAALATLLVLDVVAASYLALAMGLHEGRLDRQVWRTMTVTQAVAGLANASLALVAVVLVAADVRSVVLLSTVVAVLVVLYRAYGRLRVNYARLELLQSFTRTVGSSLATEEVVAAVLDQARTLLRAHRAEVVLQTRAGSAALHAVSLLGGPSLTLRTTTDVPTDAWWSPARHGEPVLLPASSAAGYDDRDGLAVPLLAGLDVTGVLLVADRLDAVTTFDREDLRLFETLANHAAVALANGQLVDRLRREVEEREHQASHDVLTGLPNRRLFQERTDAALACRPAAASVMICDLNGFKDVNDTLGHATGDELLRLVGVRLAATLRDRGLLARLGGDEFAVLLDNADPRAALAVAVELTEALAAPFVVDELTLDVTGSIGVAVSPPDGATASVLLQRADIAMYAAKTRGTRAELYDPAADTHSARRLSLVSDLRLALESGALRVCYQPKVGVSSGRPVGAEALVRWEDPRHGRVSPEEFVPLAERTGLIRQLTLFVLDQALGACRRWHDAGYPVGVAVNVSVRNLLDLSLPGEVAALLRRHEVAPSGLTLEITESQIMSDPARCLQVLHRLDRLGVRLSVDDFGTGYSSLGYLRRLPVDEVKIDRSFVQGLAGSDDDAAIVRSTISLCHELGLQVVAEGVEDPATCQQVASYGADTVQGWLLGRPMREAEFASWLGRAARETQVVLEQPLPFTSLLVC